MQSVFPLVQEYIKANDLPDTKVVNYQEASKLKTIFDLDLSKREGASNEEIVEAVKSVLQHSVRTSHPLFFDKLYAGSDPIGQIGEFLTSVLNTNVHTYAVAPLFVMMELEMIKKMATAVGFAPETSDGIFVPGGSYANLCAMILARHKAFPHVRASGHAGERPVVFTSAQSHYSVQRATMVMGLGMNAAVAVPADRYGAMYPEALDRAITTAKENGQSPFCVMATAGTTVVGGFDPFEAIRQVCDKHKMWMHIDGSWGGTAALSPKHRHLLKGAETADSFTWNPHKGMGVPLQCSVLLTNNHMGLLQESNASAAEYLFHPHADAQYDLGDKTLQCGRKADSLKLWLAWKRFGDLGFQSRVDTAMDNAAHMVKLIRSRPDAFQLVQEPPFTNVCFWFAPPALRKKTGLRAADMDSQMVHAHFDKVTPLVYEQMQAEGRTLVNFNPLPLTPANPADAPSGPKSLPRFFRIILNHPSVSAAELEFVLDHIEELGNALEPDAYL